MHFHAEGIPVLVSQALLRARNLGQVDLARLKKDQDGWMLEVSEVKSSEVGVEGMARSQNRRLMGSARFLAGLIGARVRLSSLVG